MLMMRWLLRSITGDRYPIRLIHPMIKRHKHVCMAFYQLMLRAKIMIAVYCRWTWGSRWRWWWAERAKLTEAAYLFQITPSLPTALTYPLMGGPNPEQKSLLIHPLLGNREILIHPLETGRSLKIWPYQVLVLILNYLELATPFIQSTKESLARSIHKIYPSPFLGVF